MTLRARGVEWEKQVDASSAGTVDCSHVGSRDYRESDRRCQVSPQRTMQNACSLSVD